MSTFKQIQRKSSPYSTRAASTSHSQRPSRSFAPVPDPLAEQASPEADPQTTQSTRLGFSLANIPISPPERENHTGLPDKMKAGIERISGLSMNDVRVHYNSSKPAQVQALAYTQGTNIHVSPGQEKHLAHEAWHVVQQKQGRVQPTLQANAVAINDDQTLEQEADVMSNKAVSGNAQVDNHASQEEEALAQSLFSSASTLPASNQGATLSSTNAQTKAIMTEPPVLQRAKKRKNKTSTSKEEPEKKPKTEQTTEETHTQITQPPEEQPPATNVSPMEPQSIELATTSLEAPQSMELATMSLEQQSSAVSPQKVKPLPKVASLSQELQTELEDAKKTAKKNDRQVALEHVKDFILKQNIVDLDLKSSYPEIQLKIAYSEAKSERKKLAVTVYKASGKGRRKGKKKGNKKPEAKITITVYSGLFENTPEAIYSTLYHEFIHAAQRTRETDETGASSTDEYMHEPQNPTEFDKQIMSPLQEIETHVREIEHAGETGIADKDPDYYRATWYYLFTYTQDLYNVISQVDSGTNKEHKIQRLSFWKGYIERALEFLNLLLNSTDPRIKNDLQRKDFRKSNKEDLTEFVEKIQSVYDKIPNPT